jgi:membrane protein YqaA with SNARE-associated domain
MKKKYLNFGFLLLFIIVWSITLAIIGPDTIVDVIGIENAYITAFIIATLGGVSTITAPSYFLTIITLAGGGANPYILGIVAGTGITIGDSLFYYLGYSGRHIAKKKANKWIQKFSKWLSEKPKWLMPIIIFIYAAFTPLPNDILTISLGLMCCYPYKYVIIPLWAGNITITILTALGTGFGFNLF